MISQTDVGSDNIINPMMTETIFFLFSGRGNTLNFPRPLPNFPLKIVLDGVRAIAERYTERNTVQ